MKTWKKGKEFLEKLEFDCEVITSLLEAKLKSLFEYSCYLKHIDGIFARLG
jgi:adenylosuccinate lyase